MLGSTEADLSEFGLTSIIHAKSKDLGEFTVRRSLPYLRRRMVGPWIFFDHMGPATFQAGEGINVRPHPHIGLATVTYLFDGAILHRDSLGSKCVIRPGDVNLMVAGKGIVHSERELPETLDQVRKLHGMQLWHALPDADEETDPAFYHYKAQTMPTTELEGVPVRVLMGTAFGIGSPVKTFASTLLAEARLSAGQRVQLPTGEVEAAVYVMSGSVNIGKPGGPIQKVPEGAMAIYDQNTVVVSTDDLSLIHI